MDGKSISAVTQKVVSDSGIISIIKKKIVGKSCPSHFKLGWGKKYAVGINAALARRYYWSF